MYLGTGAQRQSITPELVQLGFVTLKEGKPGAAEDPITQTLVALEQHAKSIGIGVHASEEIKKKQIRKMKVCMCVCVCESECLFVNE